MFKNSNIEVFADKVTLILKFITITWLLKISTDFTGDAFKKRYQNIGSSYCEFSKSRVVVRAGWYIDAGSFKFEF